MKRRALTLLAALLLVLAALAAPSQAAVNRTIVDDTIQLLQHAIPALKQSPATSQFYASGVWHSANDLGLWDYQVGPGAAAAVLWKSTGRQDGSLLTVAEETFDRAISDHQLPNGSYGPGPDRGPNSQSPDIATIWFGNELGTTYLEISPWLGSARRDRWRRALAAAADYLIHSGNQTWYINGNDNLGLTSLFYMAWRATGARRYWSAYNFEWAFTLHPPQSRWAGFGLHMLPRIATIASGSHARGRAGYLAESNPNAPGYDPYYTVAQLDTAVRLYAFSHDRRALRLANLEVNAELTRVNQNWYLNTSNGSRHYEANRSVPFLTSAVVALGWLDGRRDLQALAPSHFAMIASHYADTAGYQPPDYMGLSDEVAVILEAAAATRR